MNRARNLVAHERGASEVVHNRHAGGISAVARAVDGADLMRIE
jgi:hypothetical protein